MYLMICFLPCFCRRHQTFLPSEFNQLNVRTARLTFVVSSSSIVLFLLLRPGLNQHDRSDRKHSERDRDKYLQHLVSTTVPIRCQLVS